MKKVDMAETSGKLCYRFYFIYKYSQVETLLFSVYGDVSPQIQRLNQTPPGVFISMTLQMNTIC